MKSEGLLHDQVVMVRLALLVLSHLFAVKAASSPAATLCTPSACFTLHAEKESFGGASQKCVANGGDLVTIRNEGELEDVKSVLSINAGEYFTSESKIWIGLTLRKGNCTRTDVNLHGFQWLSGAEDSSYTSWEKAPKSTCTEERCVMMYASQNGLQWTDRSCRSKAAYLCKFLSKGMCTPLLLAGQGEVLYHPPFSPTPLKQGDLTLLPHGTYADIQCADGTTYSICQEVTSNYLWSRQGPFCVSGDRSCEYNNGGCSHRCAHSGASGVICECPDGYVLGDDEITCVLRNLCRNSPCAHECTTTQEGFSCSCHKGFQLAGDDMDCVDIDECIDSPCGHHACRNTQGSHVCDCLGGFEMIDGKCQDIDECVASRCEQGCLNSQGSFSCHCFPGFRASADSQACVDIDECITNTSCEDICTNTRGSFVCSCRQNFRLADNGINCIPDHSADVTVKCAQDKKSAGCHETLDTQTMASTSRGSDAGLHVKDSQNPGLRESPGHPTAHPDHRNDSAIDIYTSVRKEKRPSDFWVLVSVLASVIPLLVLVAVSIVIVIYRWNRSRKNSQKKNATADSYCWVSSGLAAQVA